jgi:DNA-binding SARP family transcriptional activator
VLAEARRLTRHGALTRAVAAYRKAESLTTDLDVAARWRAERRQVSQWLSRGEVVAGSWPGLVRIATRRNPGQIARSAATHRDPEARVVAALANLLAGALDEAGSVLQDAMQDVGAGQRVVGIAVYAHAAIQLLLADRAAVDRGELEAVVLEAEVADQPWWARLGFALMEAVEGRFATLELARAQADREEDLWGSGLIQLLHGIAAHAPGPLDGAAAVFDHLDAPVLRLWAMCLAAVLPDKDRLHRVRQARAACKALDMCAVLPAAQRWAAQSAAPLLREQPAAAQLHVLGGFRLTIGGVDIDQAAVRPRARMALHLLAVHAGRPVHRDVLVQAIWPESQGDAGHRNTHVAISSLRHLLEPEARRGQSVLLPRLGDSYSLMLPGGSRCDIDDFEVALARARTARIAGDLAAERASLHRALSCYGGELLPEDGLAEWVVTERERLRLAAADASERLARAEAGAGDIGTAIEYARRTLALDCYRDTAWRLLVQLHERAGDASAAHAVRREHKKMLAELELT